MRGLRYGLTVLVLVALGMSIGCPPARAQGAGKRILIAYSAISANYAQTFIAKEAGLFDKYGLKNADLIYLGGGSMVSQAMASGDVPLGMVAGSSLVPADLAGSNDILIAPSVGTVTMSLFVRKDMKKVEDLKGLAVGVTRFGSSTDLSARYILKRYNLLPGKDVNVLQLGGMPEILAGMVNGAVAGGISSMPTSLKLKKAGFVELVDLGSLGFAYPHAGAAVRGAFLKTNREETRDFVKGLIAGTAVYFKDKEYAKKIIAKYTRTTDPEILEETYNYQARYFPRVPYTSREGVQTVLDELIARNLPKAKEAKPEQFYDNSLVKELEESGFISQVFAGIK